jgi:spore coat protein JC
MWAYEKKLQYPVNIKNPSAANAKIVITQLGGADGELGASMRYLNQRYSAPYGRIKGLLTDIGTEELGHAEMISALVFQLTRDLSVEQIKKEGFGDYFVDHTTVTTVTSFFRPDLSRYSDNKCRYVAHGFWFLRLLLQRLRFCQ